MTIRDLLTASVGAFISFAISLASLDHPSPFLRTGTWISLACLIVFAIVEAATSPWLSVAVTTEPLADGRTVVRSGFRNHGRRSMDAQIVNTLVPDHLGLAATDARKILQTPESLDSVYASDYWQGPIAFVPGSTLVDLSLAVPEDGCPLRFHVGNKRRDVWVAPGQERLVNFAPIRAWLWARL